ncbi:ABC transporter ATP-binding protein [bacterium]|nr:MAG: ABC transporter ATP-binding protein [bacterium]
MSILRATQLGRSFGDFDLFGGITCSVPGDGRIGLVGPNGVGKTTLLTILAGLASPTTGSVHRARGARVGYLPQEAADAFADHGGTVYAEMLQVFEDLRVDEARLRDMEEAISGGEADDELLARYGNLQSRFEHAGGYDYPLRIRQVLTGLGFGPDAWETPVAHLSGGQKTRALLARLLLERPDLLILDEPTNHLDVEAVEWLEGTLGAWPGAILVVSHDRYFLDRVANTVWEMSATGIETYRGNYSAYVQQRQERWARRQAEHEAMMARFAKELDFIRRNIAGQRVQMAKGRLSRLSREVEAVHAGGLEALGAIQSQGWLQATDALDMERASMNVSEVGRRIGELRPPVPERPEIRLRLKSDVRGGDLVLRTRGAVIGYPGRLLFAADDITLERRARAALIGGNGTGKTTFLRTIMGELAPLAGDVAVGGGVRIGYFAQTQAALDADDTVLGAFSRHTGLLPAEARGRLAAFLFRGDDVDKRVAALSGGERGRLALAILAHHDANFLLLDEPTNHLDIPSQEVLEAVLADYPGTVLVVSHDRYLVDRLATQVWELRAGRLVVFPGRYAAMLEARRAEAAATGRADGPRDGGLRRVDGAATTAGGANGARPSKNELRRRAERAAEAEGRIAALEGEMAALEAALQRAGEAGDHAEMRTLTDAHARARAAIDAAYAEWEALSADAG